MDSKLFNKIFEESIKKYHIKNDITLKHSSEYKEDSIEFLLDKKNWIDTVQWHLEDIIREPAIEPEKALIFKRAIDKSNQDRTDLVELIDDYYFNELKNVEANSSAFIATETPAWAIDRLSILNLKIYHMREEAEREDADSEHKEKCSFKLKILLQQREDLSLAINQLFKNIKTGKAIIKTYKQMKMYNDPKLNPILRNSE
ncbi:MAG: DUF4254 domain-containing protein [Bacteroidales bacterium]|nr:DUF4254 domain-containing protein [Bacteroidales bacterium]